MQLVLEKRTERSNTIALISPLIAIGLTIVTMSILFVILGKNPVSALGVYFIDPLTDSYSLQEIAVKATPLVMIAIGLSLCYLANAWNIGAEGQFLVGAVAGSWLAVKTQGTGAGPWVMPAMLLLGATAGALYALIPAICKVRFGGFNSDQLNLLTFAISGALAGLAGIIEVAGPVGHLQPGISPGYGFTAIIVAFLGRLNPIGILIAGLFLALTFIGGEQAQIAMKIPLDVTKVFQGILLFYVLACDSLILYRFRLIFPSRKVSRGAA